MDKLIIYGDGQMASMMYEILKQEFIIVAFTTEQKCITSDMHQGLPLIAFEEIEDNFSPLYHKMFIAVGYSNMNDLRIERGNWAKQKGFSLISYISPKATVYGKTSLGENSCILEYSSIHPNTQIKDYVFVGSHINIGHDCEIDEGNWLNAGVCIGGATKLEKSCFLGINATIGNDIIIGEKCFIGANALITKNTKPASVHVAPNAEVVPVSSHDFLKFLS